MKISAVVLLGIVLLTGKTVLAQDCPKIEVTADYSYVHANPQNNNIIPTFSLNGGGGSGAFYLSKYIGIVGEFEGYGSFTHNSTVPPAYCTPTGGVNCSANAQGNLFTYNIGPIVKYRTQHFEPFVRCFLAEHTAIFTTANFDHTGAGGQLPGTERRLPPSR